MALRHRHHESDGFPFCNGSILSESPAQVWAERIACHGASSQIHPRVVSVSTAGHYCNDT